MLKFLENLSLYNTHTQKENVDSPTFVKEIESIIKNLFKRDVQA